LLITGNTCPSGAGKGRRSGAWPFDSLFWAPRRDRQVWGFRQSLEAYLPAHKRQWGYFCLPILHEDRLVGRFDPKLERKQGVLRLKALYLEEDVQPEEQLVAQVAKAMVDFMAFHNARELVIEKSQPQEFGQAAESPEAHCSRFIPGAGVLASA
jgi:uncharacterized protein YcaQ